ncbi:MAG: UDP-glucose 4-epimerase GalE [Bacteroidota bacterium]|nr:UDP-glucose 4-epimerase GalE [Bacteroidota bacterium]MDP4195114.1 UDP-glucose 4-epimerase GalE [Bacteroidota bacterium]
MNILVTGGAGYIGSHTVKLLQQKGHNVIVFDNLSRGHIEAVPEEVSFEKVDLLDFDSLSNALNKYEIDAVIHFAAFAYVGESVDNPGMYYTNNVSGSINLIKALNNKGVKKIVFSSTCSLYGNPEIVPISEKESLKPINPYAKTKFMIEHVLADFEISSGMKYVALRYFNAAGADFSGQIGESHAPETHLIPIVLQVALGKREKVSIFGDDYPTNDGTCIRDYIHVNDLADAHLRALQYLNDGESQVINLGTGRGYSVKEIIDKAEEITGRPIKREITSRRPGDPAVLIADNKKAREVLGWNPQSGLTDIIKSAWQWHLNPKY